MPRLAVATLLLLSAGALAGCGHCDGAIRWMGVDGEEGGVVAADNGFRIVGDGPGSQTSEELLADANVTPETWFLLDAAGDTVPSTLSASWGGHSCLNGNEFYLVPDAPLDLGDYTLVLRLEALTWAFLPGDVETSTWEGEEALVQAWSVVE